MSLLLLICFYFIFFLFYFLNCSQALFKSEENRGELPFSKSRREGRKRWSLEISLRLLFEVLPTGLMISLRPRNPGGAAILLGDEKSMVCFLIRSVSLLIGTTSIMVIGMT
jgi:hypothetical protein